MKKRPLTVYGILGCISLGTCLTGCGGGGGSSTSATPSGTPTPVTSPLAAFLPANMPAAAGYAMTEADNGSGAFVSLFQARDGTVMPVSSIKLPATVAYWAKADNATASWLSLSVFSLSGTTLTIEEEGVDGTSYGKTVLTSAADPRPYLQLTDGTTIGQPVYYGPTGNGDLASSTAYSLLTGVKAYANMPDKGHLAAGAVTPAAQLGAQFF